MLDPLKNWNNDFKPSLELFESPIQQLEPLCSNMIITPSNPSYLELLGLFTVHTNVSANARLSLQLW